MKSFKTWQLIVGLVLIVGGTVLFIMGVSGVFNTPKAVIDADYSCNDGCDWEFMELEPQNYENLIKEKKSFVVFVDQGGCTTADRVEEYITEFGKKNNFKVFKIMFEDMKETSLHDSVKYYPSVAVISKGKVIKWLRADEDEDSDMYNNYDAFEKWMQKYLK